MTTAVDTNVLVTLLLADQQGDVKATQTALEQVSEAGALIISPPV